MGLDDGLDINLGDGIDIPYLIWYKRDNEDKKGGEKYGGTV
jgi:hypothetical protein